MENDEGRPPGENRLETFLLDSARPRRTRHWLPRALLVLVALFVLLGIYWSREPAPPDVPAIVQSLGAQSAVPGAVSTATLIATLRTLLDKPGGFIANDVMPPGVLLDNMPAFENGALAEARTFLHALRRDFSRPESGAVEDPDLLRAEPRLMFDSSSWLAAEGEYEDGVAALASYRERLLAPGTPGARFFPVADSLGHWLDDVIAQLDDHAQRLNAAAQADAAFTDVDDRFYAARGYCWALRPQLDAVRRDFAAFFAADAEAARQAQAAVDALAGTQKPVTSPVILGGSEYGVLANHPLVMAGYVGRAESSLRALRARIVAAGAP